MYPIIRAQNEFQEVISTKKMYLSAPPYPYFVCAGSALYRPGDKHTKRTAIGVFDLIFVEYGELYITENGDSYHLEAGDILLLSPDGTHYGHQISKTRTLFHWLHFAFDGQVTITSKNINAKNEVRKKTDASLYRSTKDYIILPVYKHLSPEEQQSLLKFLKKVNLVMLDNYKKHKYINQQSNGLYTQDQFFQLLQLLQIQSTQTKESNKLAAEVMRYLMEYHHTPITLQELSEQLNFHPAHLIRCMKKEYNMTPIEALNKIRIDKAKQLLDYSSMTNAEIAASVGFTSASYFNRIFKKLTGTTPKEYKNRQLSAGGEDEDADT